MSDGLRSPTTQDAGYRRQKRHEVQGYTAKASQAQSWMLTTKAIHLRLSAGCKHRWTVWHPTSPMWHSAQPPKLSLMAPWIPMSESESMARRKAGTERAVDHAVGQGWSA